MKKPVKPIDFATTFVAEFQDPRFATRAHPIPVPPRLNALKRNKFSLVDEARLFGRVLLAAWRYPALLLFSSRGNLKPELLAAVTLSFWPQSRQPKVVFYGEMFQPDQGLRLRLEKWLMRRLSRVVDRFMVYSQQDLESFAAMWGIAPEKIRVSHYFTFHAADEAPPEAAQRAGHVFAGGKSFREFDPVVEAARLMPDLDFVLATPNLAGRTDLPPNVQAGPVSMEDYSRLISTAAVVVIPLQVGLNRSTGMLTYLEAMWAKNPILVTDAMGVREYVRNKETGLVVDGTPQGYVQAIRWALDPANAAQVKAMCERAHREVAERFNFNNHVTRLLEIWDEILGKRVPF